MPVFGKIQLDGEIMYKTVIFHVPHDGNDFEEELMSSVVIDREKFLYYHNQMRDTDATLFAPAISGAKILKFNISRLLCDVERFIGEDEIMEKYGMGFCYDRVYDGTVIKNVSSDVKQKTYEIYKRHHNKLDNLVKEASGSILLIDLHSFSRDIIVHRKIEKPLPDICIGYDEYLPDDFLQKIISVFTANGFSVDVNYPYAGSLIPNCILSNEVDRDIVSFMIEVNKDCYMRDGNTDFARVETVRRSIETIMDSVRPS